MKRRATRAALVLLIGIGAGAGAVAAEFATKLTPEITAAQARPTPRSASGHPVLTGHWKFSTPIEIFFPKHDALSGPHVALPLPGLADANVGDHRNVAARLADTAARPVYRSTEDQQHALDNFNRAALLDPAFLCTPPGTPRIGNPPEIVEGPDAVYLLYGTLNQFRVIPTHRSGHDPDKDPLPYGDSIGHWEHDTLVIDTVNIQEDTWLDGDGSFHSKDMHVIERLTRKGDALIYDVTVEDPIFAQPFVMRTRYSLFDHEGGHVAEDYPCIEKDRSHMVTTERH